MSELLENQLNSCIMEKMDAERDLAREVARLDFFNTLDSIPQQYMDQKRNTEELVLFFQQKVDFFSLKIDELNATISGT